MLLSSSSELLSGGWIVTLLVCCFASLSRSFAICFASSLDFVAARVAFFLSPLHSVSTGIVRVDGSIPVSEGGGGRGVVSGVSSMSTSSSGMPSSRARLFRCLMRDGGAGSIRNWSRTTVLSVLTQYITTPPVRLPLWIRAMQASVRACMGLLVWGSVACT